MDKIGLAEFLKLFSRDAKGIEYGAEEAIDWKNDEWLRIERDGVYMDLPPVEDLERVAIDVRIDLESHPEQDPSLPVLSFPCTAKEFEHFIEWFGLEGYYDIELLEKYKNNKRSTSSPITEKAIAGAALHESRKATELEKRAKAKLYLIIENAKKVKNFSPTKIAEIVKKDPEFLEKPTRETLIRWARERLVQKGLPIQKRGRPPRQK